VRRRPLAAVSGRVKFEYQGGLSRPTCPRRHRPARRCPP
jgi:hypothetical protein